MQSKYNHSDQTVLIIGAGPSGLVAAKECLEKGLNVRVFEVNSTIGGIWAPGTGNVWQSMRTNLSKFSCMFSDFPWPIPVNDFPNQEDIYAYLQAYAEHFNLFRHIFFNTHVTNCSYDASHWKVEFKCGLDACKTEKFDQVIVASGIFSKPHYPEVDGMLTFSGRINHAAEYKSPLTYKDKKVLVVGSGFSGCEIAADIAPHAKSIIHLVRTPHHILPRHIPKGGSELSLPLDLVFYENKPKPKQGKDYDPEEALLAKNKYLASISVQHSGDIPLIVNPRHPSKVAISDGYRQHVIDRKILIHQVGKEGFSLTDSEVCIGVEAIPVDDIIFCTGYRASLPFFSSALLEEIEFDERDQLQPLLLHNTMFHHKLPQMAFVGMYRGPYFAVIELQARIAAAVLSGDIEAQNIKQLQAGVDAERQIRKQMPRQQFPHGNFVEFVKVFSDILGVTPSANTLSQVIDSFPHEKPSDMKMPIIPAIFRLSGPGAKREVAELIIKQCWHLIEKKLRQSRQPQYSEFLRPGGPSQWSSPAERNLQSPNKEIDESQKQPTYSTTAD